MFLDIIIPQYKEDEKLIKRALDSISCQLGVDFNEIEVIMINDCSDVIVSDKLINSYKNLNIRYLRNEKNLGAGLTRRRGIDESKADYITFLDADDYFYGNAGLQLVIGCLKQTNADLVQTSFIGERYQDYRLHQFKVEADYTKAWLHAKYIKRDFLVRNDINFSKELSNNFEDSYFCSLVTGFEFDTKKAINIDYPTYYWCYNLESITRRKRPHHYFVEVFDDYLKCPILVYDKLKDHNKYFADYYFKQATCNIYGILMGELFSSKDLIEKKNNYKNEFVKMLKEHTSSFEGMEKEEFLKLYEEKINALRQSLGIELKINTIDKFFEENNIIINNWRKR